MGTQQERTALVTGGARGIGRAIVGELAHAGHQVVVADLRIDEASEAAAAIREAGGKAIATELDITQPELVQQALNEAREAFGPVEILVNNAGWDDLMPFLATDEALWRKVTEINYIGPLRVTHAVLPQMIEGGWGRVVSIGSDAGRVGSSLEAVYSGAKGGIIALTKTIAREVARHGITANTICPGPTDTPFMQETISRQENADAVIASMVKGIPMRRLAQPEEIAAAVAFFAAETSGYITGQTLSVSGGLTMA